MFSTSNFSQQDVDAAIIVEKSDLICVFENDQLMDVLKVLSKNKIQGVPVLSKDANGEDIFTGFIDLTEVVAFVAAKKAKEGDLTSIIAECKEAIAHQSIRFTKPSTTIKKAIQEMVDHRVHRLVVVEEDYEGALTTPLPFKAIKSIVTQSDIFSLMVTYSYSLADSSKFEKSISELGVGIPKVDCCFIKDRTSDALTKMTSLGFSALGVVDSNGKLVNYLGASHLKNLEKANIWDIYLPVEKFLGERQKTFQTFKLSAPLKTIISAAKDAKYHRIFFVDEHQKPIGVMTLRDFLEALVLKAQLFG